VGKTAVAEEVALASGGQVVSADSMQVYRGMDVGTAKPPAPRRVSYHCLDLVDPGVAYSAARFQADARRAIDDAISAGALPVVAGGTGLYVRAALDDWTIPAGQIDTDRRRELQRKADREGPEALHAELTSVDPRAAALLHPHNVRRVIRALEMADEGLSYADQAARFGTRRSIYDTVFVGLDMERSTLYERCDRRVDTMISRGLVGEVESLLAAGFRRALTAAQAIGYKELVPVVEEGADLEGAILAIKQATRRYAKRQLTWFRADKRIRWFDVTHATALGTAGEIVGLLSSRGHRADR
jgi:tRNA dimethylallyltransferase